MLAKYNIDPEKFEVIEIDQRKDMDKIQAYMKKVTVKCFQNWKRILTNLKILNDVFNNCKYKLLMNGTEFDTNEKCSKLISESTSSMSTALQS